MAVKPPRRAVGDESQLYEAHVPLETREISQIHRDNRADATREHRGDHIRVMDLLTAASHVGQQPLELVRHPGIFCQEDGPLVSLPASVIRLLDAEGDPSARHKLPVRIAWRIRGEDGENRCIVAGEVHMTEVCKTVGFVVCRPCSTTSSGVVSLGGKDGGRWVLTVPGWGISC